MSVNTRRDNAEEQRTLILDELALVVVPPERLEDGLVRPGVVLADELLQVLGRLLTVVYPKNVVSTLPRAM